MSTNLESADKDDPVELPEIRGYVLSFEVITPTQLVTALRAAQTPEDLLNVIETRVLPRAQFRRGEPGFIPSRTAAVLLYKCNISDKNEEIQRKAWEIALELLKGEVEARPTDCTPAYALPNWRYIEPIYRLFPQLTPALQAEFKEEHDRIMAPWHKVYDLSD